MKLKRKIALVLTACMTIISTYTATVNAQNIYDNPTFNFEMTIPYGYYAMSQDSNLDNGSIASIFGACGANFESLLKHQIIMIDSITYQPKNEYLFVVAKSDFTNKIQNFYNKSEEYLSKEWTLALADKQYRGFEFYPTPEARFVHTRSINGQDMFENYITVKNGLYYMLSCRISGDYNEYTTIDTLRKLVDSINFTSHDIIVRVNGTGIDFSQRPMIYNNRTMVPLRAIFEALGATVEWDNSTKTVTSTKDATEIKLTINSDKLYVNGNPITLDAPALLYNDTTLVPARAVSEAFNATVLWDEAARIVDINF